MIDKQYVLMMARYNCWQNQSLYGASDLLSDDARRADRGAFFNSIHETLCHLLWGDTIWLSRFSDIAPPEAPTIAASKDMVAEWSEIKNRRSEVDRHLLDWATSLQDDDLVGELSWYSGAISQNVSRPLQMLLVGFFNHQTHHRGQVHAMITAAGGKPDDTDLFIMPQDVEHRAL